MTEDGAGKRRAMLWGTVLCFGAVAALYAIVEWVASGADTRDEATDAELVEIPPPTDAVALTVRRARTAPARPSAPGRRADEAAAAQESQAQSDPEPEIRAADYIQALRDAGETGGLAAFPPPGTDPIKRGIVVPDDFELPEGYSRHHQTTDDGKDVPAILMFSPGYEFLGPDGVPIPLPPDGIVPPEMAPPGMPLRVLKLGKRRTAY